MSKKEQQQTVSKVAIRSFKEILEATQEKIEAALIPVKVRQMKAKAEMALAEAEEKLISAERDLIEYQSQKDIDFKVLINKADTIALAERQVKQHRAIIEQLFPSEQET